MAGYFGVVELGEEKKISSLSCNRVLTHMSLNCQTKAAVLLKCQKVYHAIASSA